MGVVRRERRELRWRAICVEAACCAIRRAAPATGVVLLVAAAPAAAKPAHSASRQPAVRVAASPSLFPSFKRRVSDYVVRCDAETPLRLSVTAPRSVRIAVDGRSARRGSFATNVDVTSGQSFHFDVKQRHRRKRRYYVRCLPPDFPLWSAERPGRPQAAWYVVAPCCGASTYVAIFDTLGVPVWWMHTQGPPLDASLLPDGNVVFARRRGVDLAPGVSTGTYEEHRLDGSLGRTFTLPDGSPTDRHEMRLLPNGDYVVLTYRPRDGVDLSPYGGPSSATVMDAEVDEVTPDHVIAWSWNSADHIGLAETGHWYQDGVLGSPLHLPDGRTAYDIVHINAVERYGSHRFLISLRHTDAVYSVDKSSGDVLWKLGGTPTPQSLRILGDKVSDFGGQHDVRVRRDGTITVHDNGTFRHRLPRALRFRVRPSAHTATLVERVSDREAGPSGCCGSARKLRGGHWVISWGGTHLIEETTARGRRVFALHLPDYISYRVIPVMPGRLSRTALRRGMNAMHRR